MRWFSRSVPASVGAPHATGWSGRCVNLAGRRQRDENATARANLNGGSLANYLLKLYVTGTTPRAQVAIANLRRICEEELGGAYELEIIDVLEHPQLAEEAKILATPTLIKQLPPPLRRVIGDLSDTEKVLLGLEAQPRSGTPKAKNNE